MFQYGDINQHVSCHVETTVLVSRPKIQNSIKFEEVNSAVLENGGVPLELNTKTRILKYENVISSKDGGCISLRDILTKE